MFRFTSIPWPLTLLVAGSICCNAPATDGLVLEFTQSYCLDCHEGEEPEGQVRLDRLFAQDDTAIDRKAWTNVIKHVEFGRMPPEDAEQPPDEERQRFVELLRQRVDHVDCSGPTDPGVVTLRRLTRYEYRRTVKRSTGLRLRGSGRFSCR